MLRLRQDLADAGHGFGETALLGADPPGVTSAGYQEAGRVGFASPVSFFCDTPGMVVGRAVTGFAVCGADAVSVLGNFESDPVEVGERGDQAGHNAGFADAARVAADDDNRHKTFQFPASVLSVCVTLAIGTPVLSDIRGSDAPVFPRKLLLCHG